jgi:hypothetical protein
LAKPIARTPQKTIVKGDSDEQGELVASYKFVINYNIGDRANRSDQSSA